MLFSSAKERMYLKDRFQCDKGQGQDCGDGDRNASETSARQFRTMANLDIKPFTGSNTVSMQVLSSFAMEPRKHRSRCICGR